MSTVYLLRRGSYTFFASNLLSMPEGEGYEAGIPAPDGSYLETLYYGGHDGQNKLLGGGFQSYTGPRSFTAPVGVNFIDASGDVWYSDGSNWRQLNGGGSGSGSSAPISLANINCGTWA